MELALATATEHQRNLQKTTVKIAKILGGMSAEDRYQVLAQLNAAHCQLSKSEPEAVGTAPA